MSKIPVYDRLQDLAGPVALILDGIPSEASGHDRGFREGETEISLRECRRPDEDRLSLGQAQDMRRAPGVVFDPVGEFEAMYLEHQFIEPAD